MDGRIFLGSLALFLGGCSSSKPITVVGCPDAAAVAPASIGGAGYVAGLTGRLGGGNRENVVEEAVKEMRRMDPAISPDAMTNVLIAADCPLAVARPDHDASADRARIAQFRAQIDQILLQ
ncbi:MAG: hypothetical protein V4460_01940 [Pseudomonadota bacterium]|jgi:hypothetical protein